jgi:DNA-binding NarL/FixJ family response regulator
VSTWSVLLADADEPVRAGLKVALRAGGLTIAGEAASAPEAVAVAERTRPDLCLLSTALPGGALDAMRELMSRLPGMRLVVISERPNGDELLAAVLAGAVGYLGRDMHPERLPHALKGVLHGEVALPRRYTEHVLEALRGRSAQRSTIAAHTDAALTGREWEVLHLVADGRSTGEMALRLGVTQVTVRRHVSSLLHKLGVRDRAAAAALLRPDAD